MASGKNLGVFWGDRKVFFVETAGNVPARIMSVALPGAPEAGYEADHDVNTTGLIQKFIRDEHIIADEVKLSIPTGDTIIRSFLFPVMSPNEIVSAVEYEVKKYLPFSLKDLSYAYHPITVTDNKIKKIRVIFVAVRRSLLERYTHILQQAKLNVVFSEPAPLSLARALLAKKIVPADWRAAVLQIEGTTVKVIFMYEGLVPFIREFPLNTAGADPELVKARFLNEIHNSLEFYTSHYFQQPVKHMVVLSSSDNMYSQWLQEGFGITVKPVDPTALVGTQPAAEQMGIISAFGASLANEGKLKSFFNFSGKKAAHALSFLGQVPAIDIAEYMGAVKVAVACAVVLTGVCIFTQMGISHLKDSLDALKAKQGKFEDLATEDIQAKLDRNTSRLEKYKKVVLKSAATPLFAYMAALLPEGVWLKSFNAQYTSAGRWSVDLSGYVYAENPEQEISVANDFLSRIKKEKNLAKYFNNMNLTKLQRQDIDGYTVISFNLSCM